MNFRWRKTLDKWQHSWPLNGRKFADRSYDRWDRPFFKILYSREKLYSNFLVSQTISVYYIEYNFILRWSHFRLAGGAKIQFSAKFKTTNFSWNWYHYCCWWQTEYDIVLFSYGTRSHFQNSYMVYIHILLKTFTYTKLTSTFFPKNYKPHRETRSHLKRISGAAFTKNRIPKQHYRFRIA